MKGLLVKCDLYTPMDLTTMLLGYHPLITGSFLTFLHMLVQCLTCLAHDGYFGRVQQQHHCVRILGTHIHSRKLLVGACKIRKLLTVVGQLGM